MLLSWRERYIAVLGAHRVGLCRRKGREVEWLGSKVFTAEQSPLASLEQLLLERGKPGIRLQVVLSSTYSRAFLVPWREQIASPEELQALAQVCFEDIYGHQSADWLLRLSPEGEGMSRLASAILDELALGLLAVAETCSLQLVSVQPYLMAAFNRFRPTLSAPTFLFVLVEQGRSTLLVIHENQWLSVRTVVSAQGNDALSHLINRECLLQRANGVPLEHVYLHAPNPEDAASCVFDEQFQNLCLPLPRMAMRDALYVMAQAVR